MAAELHALLAAAGVSAPYVLVGHSAGGLNVRLFAAEYPDEVVGMVLVDATTPDVGARLWSRMGDGERQRLRERMRRGPDGWDYDSFVESMRRVSEAPPLGDRPLVVLTRGRDGSSDEDLSPAEAAERFAVWDELQAALPLLSTNSRHERVENARHFIQWDAPGTVVRAVRDVVLATRTGRRLEGARSPEPASAFAPLPAEPEPAPALAAATGSAGERPSAAPGDAPEPGNGAAAEARAARPEAVPPAAPVGSLTLWQRAYQGGVSMIALLGLSMLALATARERARGFRQQRGSDRGLFEQASALWSEGRFAELDQLCG
jgi:pimeloyl-ACP methyl ester carboxylesterase